MQIGSITKVYLVTPSFNAADTISRTIQSVVSQAGEFDIVYHVQDGGSQDGTVGVLERWSSLLKHGSFPISCRSLTFSWEAARDCGMYDAISKGFDRFTPEEIAWMGWINSDDVLLPTALPLLHKIDRTPLLSGIVHWVTGAAATCSEGCQTACDDRCLCAEVISLGLADGKHWGFVQQEGTFFRQLVWQSSSSEAPFKGLRYAGDWNLWRCFARDYRIFQFKFPTAMFSSSKAQVSKTRRNEYEAEIHACAPCKDKIGAMRSLLKDNVVSHYLRGDYMTSSLVHETKSAKEALRNRLAKLTVDLGVQAREGRAARNNHRLPSVAVIYPPAGMGAVRQVQRKGNVIAYDAEWQYPAVTERHAFKRIESHPPPDGVVYLAFPWATLIDLCHCGKDTAGLRQALEGVRRLLATGERVVTVCQHILMLKFQHFFAEAGVRMVFWSHAVRGQEFFPDCPQICIRPFPLYPVQAVNQEAPSESSRTRLFCFAGAKPDKWYLTQSRKWILKHLRDDSRGVIIGREEWHYDRVVYGWQVNNERDSSEHELVNERASAEFRELLKTSIFALCPCGSGPNSIRLWESIGLGAIPVIIADTYWPPGKAALWELGVVFCQETEQSIKDLPDKLASLAQDKGLLERKRLALKQLWMLYGPDGFIYDIQGAFLEQAMPTNEQRSNRASVSFGPLLQTAECIATSRPVESRHYGPFLLGCGVRAMADPSGFVEAYAESGNLRLAFWLAMANGAVAHKQAMEAVLRSKRIVLP